MFNTLYFFPAFLIHLKWIEIDIKSRKKHRKKRGKNVLKWFTFTHIFTFYESVHITHSRTCSPRKCGSIPPFYCCWFTWSCLNSSIFLILLLLSSKLIVALNFNCVKEEHLQPPFFFLEHFHGYWDWIANINDLEMPRTLLLNLIQFQIKVNRSGERAVYVKNLEKYSSIKFYVLFTKSV